MWVLPPVLKAAQTMALLAEWAPELAKGQGPVSIDASGVKDLDSSCVALLLALKRRAQASERPLILVAPSTALVALIGAYGLASVLLADAPSEAAV